VPLVEIRPGRPDEGGAPSLIAAAVAELAERYGGGEDPAVDPHDLRPPRGAFVLALLDGEPVGCGGVRLVGPGVGEIKRMYVAPAARGRGLGRALLAGLERAARDLGCTALRLETGLRQPEAIALYEDTGYRRIPGYGHWADSPLTVCFEKRLEGSTNRGTRPMEPPWGSEPASSCSPSEPS
jgi:GNAT superfamily N-acetyltransferase